MAKAEIVLGESGGSGIGQLSTVSYNTNGTLTVPITSSTKTIQTFVPFGGAIIFYQIDVATNSVLWTNITTSSIPALTDITSSCENHEKSGNNYVVRCYAKCNGSSNSQPFAILYD